MYKALYLKIEIKAGGRVDRPSSRSVTSQLMVFERENAHSCVVSHAVKTVVLLVNKQSKVLYLI